MGKIFRASRKTVSLVWHAKHGLTHVLFGVSWYLLLKTLIPEVKPSHLWVSIIASLLPDIEHFYHLYITRKRSNYAKDIIALAKKGRLVELLKYIEKHHKHDIFLPFHHIVTPFLGLLFCVLALRGDRIGTAVFLGAFMLHYVFDILEDLVLLGKLNPNWIASPLSMLRKRTEK